MADLIERQAAIDAVRRLQTYKLSESDDMVLVDKAEVQTELMMLPAAQPEIVRCKDCKNYYFADNRVPSEQSWVCDAWGVDQTAHMGYCFKAERRTDE